MRLVSVTPINLRAFWKCEPIDLASGVTLLFGKNNSGKTTLLEALGTGAALGVHRGPENAPREDEVVTRVSAMQLEFVVDTDELSAFVQSTPEYSLIGDIAHHVADEAYRYRDQVVANPLRIKV